MRYLSLLLILLTVPVLVFAQAKPSFTHQQGHVVIRPNASVEVADFFQAFAKTLRTDAHTTWEEGSTTGSGEPGALTHHRFGQLIDGVPVLGATIVLHARTGNVAFATGKSYPHQQLSTSANLSHQEATRRATEAYNDWADRQRSHLLAKDFKGEPIRVDEHAEQHEPTANTPRLVFLDRQFPSYTGSLVLAFEVNVGPVQTRRAVYIDAANGELVTSIPLVAHHTVPGTVETGYYGTQAVMVEQVDENSFRLVDSSRGIVVLNSFNREITHTDSDFPLQAGDKGGMANDVFYGASRFYDLLDNKFDWRGIDGEGEFLRATVADGNRDYVNAVWTGEAATFGGGSCHYGPLTTLDVVGHEFAHGITQRTSNLVYSGQSGALNEGMSDIFGKALELYEQPDQFNWILGNRFADSEYATPFRSMEDPNLYNKPKVVGGEFWNDGAGVHTNSGPLGHWFYLLVEGGSGTNDLGTTFNVQPVSLDVAFRVAFELNRDYLTESSGYQDAFTNCMLLVEARYGSNSATYTSFAEAWKAIGMPTTGGGPTTGIDLAVFSFNASDPTYCHPTDSVELVVVISNRGDDVLAGTRYTLTATLDEETSTVARTFDSDFLKGELAFLDVTFPMRITPGQYRADVMLTIADDIEPANNSGSQTAFVMQAPHVVEISSVTLDPLNCFAEERGIYVNLLNRGCETYSGPVVIDLFDVDSTVRTTINAGDIVLPPKEQRSVVFSVPYEDLEGAIGLRYDVPNDPLPDDNVVGLQLGRPRVLTATDLLRFSDSDAMRYVSLDNGRGHMGVVNEGGRDWLSTTGYYTTPFRLPCLETERNMEVAADLSKVELCVDFETEAAPKLAFELKQYYGEGDPDFPALREVNRGISIVTPGEAAPPIYLDSRPDGIITSEEIDLPSNYKGLVRFAFYNASGNPNFWEMSDPAFERFDYTFVNDLRLAGVSGTRELAVDFSILPNPARSYFTVQTTSTAPLRVEVVNSIGVGITEQVLYDSYTFSTSGWPNGLYQVRLSNQVGSISTKTLMIAR